MRVKEVFSAAQAFALCAVCICAGCLPQTAPRDGDGPNTNTGTWGEVDAFPSRCERPAFRMPPPVAARGEPIYSGPSPLEPDIIAQTNSFRRQAGLPALRCEAGLSLIAMRHSVAMAEQDALFHVDSSGARPFDRMRRVYGSFYGRVAENVAYQTVRAPGFSASDLWAIGPLDHEALAERYIRLWRDSPGHRANLLRSGVSHIGVGVALRGNRLYVTQMFAGAQPGAAFRETDK